MANYDNPNGFRPLGYTSRLNQYTASATITKGDLVAFVAGKMLPFAPGTHTAAAGVAASSAVANGAVMVWDDPDEVFTGQTSGTYVAATYDGALVACEGTTGIMEVDENGTNKVLRVLGAYPQPGSEDAGANARVKFKIATHVFGEAAADLAGIDAAVSTLTNAGAGYTTIADAAASTMDDLTDNTAATADTTIADVSTAVTGVDGTGSNAASKADVDTRLTAIDANFADLVAQLAAAKADITALVTKVNAILARLEAAGVSASS